MKPPAIAAQFSLVANGAVAGDENRRRVAGASAADSARRQWTADFFRQLRIGQNLSRRNFLQLPPHPPLEIGAAKFQLHLQLRPKRRTFHCIGNLFCQTAKRFITADNLRPAKPPLYFGARRLDAVAKRNSANTALSGGDRQLAKPAADNRALNSLAPICAAFYFFHSAFCRRPSMAARPTPISAIPAKCSAFNVSFKNAAPKTMEVIGTKKVTSATLVAPDTAKMRK